MKPPLHFRGKLSQAGAFVADVTGEFQAHHHHGAPQDWRGRLAFAPDVDLVVGAEYELTVAPGQWEKIIIERVGLGTGAAEFRVNGPGLP